METVGRWGVAVGCASACAAVQVLLRLWIGESWSGWLYENLVYLAVCGFINWKILYPSKRPIGPHGEAAGGAGR